MKKTRLLYLALLNFASMQAHGKIYVGAKLGLSYSIPFFKDTKLVSKKGNLGFLAGAKGLVDLSKWQMGIAADYVTMSYSYETGIMQLFSQLQTYSMKYKINVPMQPVYAFINRKVTLQSSYWYFGLNAGHVFFSKNENNSIEYPDFVHPRMGPPVVKSTWPVNSFFGGVQAGYNFDVSEKLSVNAEIAIHAIPVTTTLNYSDRNTWNAFYERKAYFLYAPLSIGVNYKFEKNNK